MTDYKLLLFAFNKREWATVAYLMIGLYSKYIEGYIDDSKIKFNKVFEQLPVPALKEMQSQNPGFDFSFVGRAISSALPVTNYKFNN